MTRTLLAASVACDKSVVPVTAAGSLIFGGIGALGGAIIGSTFTKWTRVDPETLRRLPR